MKIVLTLNDVKKLIQKLERIGIDINTIKEDLSHKTIGCQNERYELLMDIFISMDIQDSEKKP